MLKGLQAKEVTQAMILEEENQNPKTVAPSFKKQILEGEETVKHYLGYRVLEEKRIEGHFHLVDMNVGHDRVNYCITCHGDIPHDKIKEVRAFSNMHASFISCQTCHVKLEGENKTGVFKWYDKASGNIVPSPVNDSTPPGTYNAKIIPFEKVNGTVQRIDSPEKIEFAREYSEKEKSLSDVQKSKAQKIIHQQMSKKPYNCEDCHQKEQPLLPFAELGFPKHRIDIFVSTEVIGMIKKYTEFYIPRILEPGLGTSEPETNQQGTP